MYLVSFVASPNEFSLLTSKALKPTLFFFPDHFQSLLCSKISKVDCISLFMLRVPFYAINHSLLGVKMQI